MVVCRRWNTNHNTNERFDTEIPKWLPVSSPVNITSATLFIINVRNKNIQQKFKLHTYGISLSPATKAFNAFSRALFLSLSFS